ncbi:MAG: FtsQ-type POTRA domain-containing protein [Chlorobium phaeobacteroides]|uniref:Polypeptide-transport-associated domain protein FtsQ-type n=1 Tax=Chlorobium phaeobacteroides (strain BS1) TaxID=331678 RepID=B3EQB5_CHLPB|nr:FtsQ-type POTRA domain-containing protein [Chlorobium phaeobacteroides]MBL6956199.1 FtsQ-type POTRA domain-containing protein [Chlorobium phaeobacteroides]
MEGFVYEDDSGISQTPAGEPEPDAVVGTDRSGPGWKAIALIMLIMLVGLFALGLYAQQWKKSVWVREVVFSGNHLLSGDELKRKTEGLVGKNIGDVDSKALSEELMTLPYVRRADVAEELNGIIRISLKERLPMARLVRGEKVQVIDTEGYILPWRDHSSVSSLLRVTGLKTSKAEASQLSKARERSFTVLREVIDAVKSTEYARLLVRDIVLSQKNTTYFSVAGSPTRFIVGNDGDYKEKLKKFEIFWQKVVSKKGLDGYATVDLRFAGKVFAVENRRQSSLNKAP